MTPTDMLTFGGITQPVREWAMDYGIVPAVILGRLERGMTTEAAITLPMVVAKGQKLPAYAVPTVRRKRKGRSSAKSKVRRIDFQGESLTVSGWADRLGVSAAALRSRVRLGWTDERIVTVPVRPHRSTDRLDPSTDHQTPGVPSDLGPFVGTGAGSTARETPNITFPEKAEA